MVALSSWRRAGMIIANHAARYRLGLGAVVAALGVQAIVTQSRLLREALVRMFGTELAWGVVLTAWLLGLALGGGLGGRFAPRLRRPELGLVGVMLILSAATCFDLWLFRGARGFLGVAPGEWLPLPGVVLASLVLVSPTSALVGLAFPLACRLAEQGGEESRFPSGPLGAVYALESGGSLIGGAAFSFWAVEHLSPIESVLVCSVATALASATFLAHETRRRLWALVLGGVALATLTATLLAGDSLRRLLVERRWSQLAPGYELVAEMETKYQNLAVARLAEQFTLYSDGQVSTDFPDPHTFAPLAHFWMCQHPAPERVLVLGGGAEGLLAEILRHPVIHLDYVEPDPQQIAIIEPLLTESDRLALHDRRVTIHHVDARHFVKTVGDRFDLVIARLPEPTSALRARFYTDEFFGELRRSMTSRSVLAMTAAAAPGELSAAAGEYLGSLRATLARHFPHVTVGWGDPAQVLAATDAGLVTTDPAVLVSRYRRRGVESELFDPLWFEGATDWLDLDKLRRRAEQLNTAQAVAISTDLRPVIYLKRLVLLDRMMGGGSTGSIEWLRSVKLSRLSWALALAVFLVMLAGRLRSRSRAGWATGAVSSSIATTGFATMALSIVWLFAFQNLYGYVYQRIGWIVAVFMGGLVVGSLTAGARSRRLVSRPLRLRLIAVDFSLAALALIAVFLLPALGALQVSRTALLVIEWVVLVMVALTGVGGGAAFALAGGLQVDAVGRADRAAGSIVGADNAGAALGALLTGILLVPVFGTAAAAFLLAGLKLLSAVLLAATAQWRPDHRRG